MKRIQSNFYKLHVLKDAKPKLRKAIISNCDKELIHTISECALNVLRQCESNRLSEEEITQVQRVTQNSHR